MMDLSAAGNYRRDGVVLIGDAFQTSCPAAGTGVTRLLSDVDRLCNVHVPRWLATPGMGAQKMAQFYDDPQKRAVDARSLKAAHFRCSFTIDTTLQCEARPRLQFLRRSIIGRMDQGLARYTRAA